MLVIILVFARNFNRTFTAAIAANLKAQTLVQELMLQKDAAEKANLAKTRFLAAASHDLRQPMHAIGLLVGIIRDRKNGHHDEELIDKIHTSVLSMENLFTGLLDISRLDAGVVKPNVTAFPLANLLEVIKLHFMSAAEERELRFRIVNTSAVVFTDAVILERIIANLVSNAIRYTRKGRVLIGCRRKLNAVRIEVWDTGMGIPQQHLEDVFQEFFQLENPERDRGKGLGLGLSIVKRSASLLNLPVTLRSTIGTGSCFSVEVPRTAVADVPPTSSLEAARASDVLFGSFILVIDDEQDIRFAMRSVLEQWGCHTVCAGSVEDALARLEEHLRVPDLIITDYRLREGVTGIEALQRVRAALEEDIPAIVLTGDIAAADIQQLSRFGVPLAHKPVSAEHLKSLVLQVLSAARTDIPA